jgi:SulP family sulfate permease
MLLYWLWGSSRELNVGPESTVAIMVATILAPIAEPGSDQHVTYAVTLALLVGLVLAIGGLFRLGRVADFLSRPVLAGYVFGSGILIVSSQLAGLFGIDVDASLYLTDVAGVLRNLDQTNVGALAIGLGTIAVILVLRRLAPAVPGALVAVVATSLLVLTTDIGVDVVGAFPTGLPQVGLPDVSLSDVGRLVGPAFAVALLVFPDSVLTGQSLATAGKYRLDANREFFGVGAANIGSGLFGGFPVNGSQSRSFVLRGAGARTQVSNLWAVAFVVLTLLLLAPAFDYLPTAALAGIVIVAGLGLLEIVEFRSLWRYRRTEFWLAAFTAAAVLGLGMLVGILVAVGLSLVLVVQRAADPHTAVLGRLPGTDTFRDVADHPDAETTPGLLVYRFDAPVFFANAGRLRDGVLAALDEADEPVQHVLLDAELVYDIDSTGAQVVMELLDTLDDRGITMSMARVRTEIRDELDAAGITSRLAEPGIHLEVDDGVAAYRSSRPS